MFFVWGLWINVINNYIFSTIRRSVSGFDGFLAIEIAFGAYCDSILVCEEQADDEEYDRHDRE